VKPEFRECVATDREWAYALKSEAYREAVEQQFGPWNEEFQRALFATRWDPARWRVILVEGRAAGLLALEDREGELWLADIALAREWRGRGIGSTILRDLLARAGAAKKALRLQVLKSNRRAEQLYLRLGFRRVAESETHYRIEWTAQASRDRAVAP
jgi:ribosomal protein S18 acetylase RimI-like enzyme